MSYVLQVLNSVMMFSGVFLQMSRSLASAPAIREVLTEQPDLANAAAPVETIPDGRIDFDHVSFKYNAKAEKTPCPTSRCTSQPVRRWALSAAPARPKRRWCS